MSSAPAGIDVREYAYAVFHYEPADALLRTFSANRGWLVTRIQAFAAAATAAQLTLVGTPIPIAAGGCLDLEPNGGYRGELIFTASAGALLLVEYWYQAKPTGIGPAISVVPP